MYCTKCGTKIRPGKGKCEKCGAPAPAPDYCGGFWGLLSKPESGDGAAAAAAPKEDREFSYNTWSGDRPARESTRSTETAEKRSGGVRIEDPRNYFWSKAAIPAIVAAALFLVITIVISVRGGGERTRLQDQLSKQSEEMQGLREENAGLDQTVGQLTSENTTLQEEKEKLEGQVSELEEENRRLMRLTMEESKPAGTKDEAVGDPTKNTEATEGTEGIEAIEETEKTEEVEEEESLTDTQAAEELNSQPSLLKGTGK